MSRPAPLVACAAALALLPLAACTTAEQAADATTTAGQAVMQAATNPTLSTADAYFMDQAARSGLAAVEAGGLAQHRAARPDIRRFAAATVADRNRLDAELDALAQRKRISLPTTPNAVQQQMLSELLGLSGATFDRQYLDQQVTLQQRAIALYRDEAKDGTDADVRAFASRALPLLQHHLVTAEQLGGQPSSA